MPARCHCLPVPAPRCKQEVVEATAEEANRKLQLNLHDKVGAGGKAAPPSPAELEAFGLTQEFADWVRTLNYRWVLGVGWGLLVLGMYCAACCCAAGTARLLLGRLSLVRTVNPSTPPMHSSPHLLPYAVRSESSQPTTCCR